MIYRCRLRSNHMNPNVSQMHEYQGQGNQDKSQPTFCIEWMYKHAFTSIQMKCFGSSFESDYPPMPGPRCTASLPRRCGECEAINSSGSNIKIDRGLPRTCRCGWAQPLVNEWVRAGWDRRRCPRWRVIPRCFLSPADAAPCRPCPGGTPLPRSPGGSRWSAGCHRPGSGQTQTL